jgi:hypothetical protein
LVLLWGVPLVLFVVTSWSVTAILGIHSNATWWGLVACVFKWQIWCLEVRRRW